MGLATAWGQDDVVVEICEKVLRNAQLLHYDELDSVFPKQTDPGHRDLGVARGQPTPPKVRGRRSACDATPETPARAGRPPSSDLRPHADACECDRGLVGVGDLAFGTDRHHRCRLASIMDRASMEASLFLWSNRSTDRPGDDPQVRLVAARSPTHELVGLIDRDCVLLGGDLLGLFDDDP